MYTQTHVYTHAHALAASHFAMVATPVHAASLQAVPRVGAETNTGGLGHVLPKSHRRRPVVLSLVGGVGGCQAGASSSQRLGGWADFVQHYRQSLLGLGRCGSTICVESGSVPSRGCFFRTRAVSHSLRPSASSNRLAHAIVYAAVALCARAPTAWESFCRRFGETSAKVYCRHGIGNRTAATKQLMSTGRLTESQDACA